MRRMPSIFSPSRIKHEYHLTSLKDKTASAYNVKVLDRSIVSDNVLELRAILSVLDKNIVRLYQVNGQIFVLTDTNELYRVEQEKLVFIANTTNEPYVIRCCVDGVNYYVIGDSDKTILLDDNFNLTTREVFCYGDGAILYGQMLFVYRDNQISFSMVADCDNFDSGLNNGGSIRVSEECGKIASLVAIKNKLIIVCKNAILTLTIDSDRENYKLQKEDVSVNVLDNSVYAIGDKIFLVSDDKLCYYENSKLSLVNIDVDLSKYKFNGQCGGRDNKCFYSVVHQDKNEYAVLVYDALTKSSNLITCDSLPIINKDCILDGKVVKRIEPGKQKSVDFLWESKLLDLSFGGLKTLKSLSLTTNERINVQIIGKYTQKTFSLQSGCHTVGVGIQGGAFRLIVSGNANSINVGDIRLTYIVKEEN